MATLEVVRAPERMAKSIALLKATTIFGRDPTSDVRLQWDGVSRQHLRLEADARFYNGSGLPTKFILIDSGGANGTFLNGERVTKVSVRDGDRIAIGRGRHLPQGGQMADSNIEYLFVLRTLTKPALAPAHKPAQDRAGSAGVRRQPLGGQEVADGQRRHRDARAGDVPGEVFPPCTSMVYPPSRYAPSAADNRMPDAELVLEFVYGCRGWDTARAVKWFDHSRIIFLAGAFVVIYDKDEHTQRFFTEHDDDVVALAIHPRLPLAASGSIASRERRTPEGRPSCTIMIWNVETRERTLSPEWPSRGVLSRIHQQRIEAMEFDRTGQFLVTYGDKEDGTTMICVYDWKSGKPWFHLSAGASVVHMVKHAPGGNIFVQCSDRGVRFYDYARAKIAPDSSFTTGGYLSVTKKPTAALAVEFTEQGQAIVGMGTGHILFFANKGTEIKAVGSIKAAHAGRVTCLEQCAEGLVSAGDDGLLKLWRYEWDGTALLSQPIVIAQVSLRPYAVQGYHDRVWATSLDYLDGRLVVATSTNHILMVVVSEMGRSTRRSAAGSSRRGGAESIHDRADDSVSVVAAPHSGEARRQPDGSLYGNIALNGVASFPLSSPDLFCSTGGDCTLRIWNSRHRGPHTLANGQTAVRSTGMPGMCCTVSPDGRWIAVGHDGGQVTVWESETMLCSLENAFRKRCISCISYSPDGRLLAVGSREGSVDLYGTQEKYRRLGSSTANHSTTVTSMDYSSDRRLLRTCDYAGRIAHWVLPGLKAYTGHESDLRDVEWHTETCVFSWSKKGIWSPGYTISDINCVALSPSRRSLVAAEEDGSVRLFRYPAVGDTCQIYSGHCSAVVALMFSSDDRYLFTVGGYDLCIFQWKHLRAEGPLQAKSGMLDFRAD